MAVEMFLEFQNPVKLPSGTAKVVGESADKAPPNAIAVSSVSFGVENATNIGSSQTGAGSGKAKFDGLEVTKNVDAATPYFFSMAGSGDHFTEAALYIRTAGASTD